MEEWGSGYKRMTDACRKEGYPDPKWEELGTSIRVTFYPHSKASLTKAKKQKAKSQKLSLRQNAILNLFAIGESLSFHQISSQLSPSVSERTLRYDLVRLKDTGAIIPGGKGRSLVWTRQK